MIASIDSRNHIIIYLADRQLVTLDSERLEGTLIRCEKPKNQGKLYLQKDFSMKDNLGIKMDDSRYRKVIDDFVLSLFMGIKLYDKLLEFGRIGVIRSDNSKINIFDHSKLNYTDTINMQQLEYFRDSKDRIPDLYK